MILLDEPTANLDADAMSKIRSILSEMKAAGKTILIAEHRLSWLRDLMDTVYYMENGRITHKWSGADFFSMDDEERMRLGLRLHHSVRKAVPRCREILQRRALSCSLHTAQARLIFVILR